QWDLDHAILSLLRDGPLGRAALMQKLKAQERDISEYALRRRLEQLEQTGLLVTQLGCNGTAITENGLRSLQQARAT
ncbi:MAG TPA: winged-helix domain-containing protein, partial [Clostridia bacterium]|nr:winged-helix domain-containing protein [Clostridia bacterium]